MIALTRLALCAGFCLGGVLGAAAADGSGLDWGARDPTPCPSLTQSGPPTPEAAATLVRCAGEVAPEGGVLSLMENVQVQVGGPVPYLAMYNRYVMPDADTTADTYPIRGSFTRSDCMTRHDAAIYGDPDFNCEEADVAVAEGLCWKTSFSEWRCRMTGPVGPTRKPTAPPQ